MSNRAIPFVKMHGLGNDYVYVSGHAATEVEDPVTLARAVSDRHLGIGADGLVLVLPSRSASVGMRMWNADGSESGMCGNALRCVARLAVDRELATGPELTIETGSGIREACFLGDDRVRVSMGAPRLERTEIPMLGSPVARVVEESLEVDGEALVVSAVSMGNPHVVIEVPDTDSAPVERLGPRLERDPRFPERTNVGFVEVRGEDRLRLRVWERGSGETRACGSGAAAATVLSTLRGRVRPPIEVELPGGVLSVDWRPGEQVWIEGPATYVFEGLWPLARVDTASAGAGGRSR